MIVKNLKILLQNVHKNSLIVNTLLEIQNQFDIIFIQEPPWSEIRQIPSSSSRNGELLMRTNHHPNWISVKIVDGGLYFIFSFHFYFTLLFFFFLIFLFLEQLGLGFISHAVTSVTK